MDFCAEKSLENRHALVWQKQKIGRLLSEVCTWLNVPSLRTG
jgi:hypothetical protein